MAVETRPLFILALALACVLSSYVLTLRSGVLSSLGPLRTPPVSLLMCDGPARIVGQIGFPAVALLFASCVPPMLRGLDLALGTEKHMLIRCVAFGSAPVAFLALAVVGALPLQRDICQVMLGRRELKVESIIHQVAAAVFFIGALVHMGAWLQLVTSVDASCVISSKSTPRSFTFKKMTDTDKGGLQQYLLILCVASFFSSYTLELQAFAKLKDASGKRKKC
ncbi:MAG: hypothetical protein SGPRY_010558 [Prymnesium sp.]